MTRPLIAILLLALALPATAAATTDGQADRSELRVGVGAAPVQTLLEFFTDITLATLSFGTIESSTESENAALFAEWTRPLNDRSSLIVHANYNRYEKTFTISGSGAEAGALTDEFYTLMLGVKRYYVRSDSFGLYIDLMGGVCMLRESSDIDEMETENATLLAWQVTPLGLRVGKGVALDLALGLGYKGLLSAGVDIAF